MNDHEHKFVIPVKWEYLHVSRTEADYLVSLMEYANAKKVTKLMCECGEVKEL